MSSHRALTQGEHLMLSALFDQAALHNFWFRYLHVLAGIAWIGLLYYFNFVQVPGLAAYGDEGKARNITMVPRSLLALCGGSVGHRVANFGHWSFSLSVCFLSTTGRISWATMRAKWCWSQRQERSNHHRHGSWVFTMAANVWMIIWKNQKVVYCKCQPTC
jgi:hypothetical protein